MIATRKTRPPSSFKPVRITAMTISATKRAAATPTAHKGSVNVPVERSSPGNQSRLIRASPPHQSGRSMAQRSKVRQLKRGRAMVYCIAHELGSVHLDAWGLHDLGPFLDVGAQVLVELG